MPNSGRSTCRRRALGTLSPSLLELLGRLPDPDARRAAVDDHKSVRIGTKPRSLVAIGPDDSNVRRRGIPEAGVDPAELAADVTAADRELAPGDRVGDSNFEPPPDCL